MADNGIKSEVMRVKSFDSKEIRQNIWRSRAFKKQAITYAARWVALYSMCGNFLGEIRLTQKELYVYITENPTREECRAKLRKMCQDFNEDADSARARLELLNSMQNHERDRRFKKERRRDLLDY